MVSIYEFFFNTESLNERAPQFNRVLKGKACLLLLICFNTHMYTLRIQILHTGLNLMLSFKKRINPGQFIFDSIITKRTAYIFLINTIENRLTLTLSKTALFCGFQIPVYNTCTLL